MDRDLYGQLEQLAAGRDQIVLVSDLSWRDYEALLRTRGERARPKLAYLDGELEVTVSTSIRHELWKTLIARLVEMWAVEREIELVGAGETTFRKRAKRAGVEPDECYWVETIRDHRQSVKSGVIPGA